jgi:hypothetical protein
MVTVMFPEAGVTESTCLEKEAIKTGGTWASVKPDSPRFVVGALRSCGQGTRTLLEAPEEERIIRVTFSLYGQIASVAAREREWHPRDWVLDPEVCIAQGLVS